MDKKISYKIKYSIKSNLAEVVYLTQSVVSLLKFLDMNENGLSELELSLSELVNNSIIHGYENKSGGFVECLLDFDEEFVYLILVDGGKEIPEEYVSKLTDPDYDFSNEEPEYDGIVDQEIPTASLGFIIVKGFFTQIDYRREKGENFLFLTKSIKSLNNLVDNG